MFLQEIFVVQDCLYYNDGSSTNGLLIDSGVSCTSNGDYITITTSTSGEKIVKLPTTLTNTDNWEYSVEIGAIGTNQSLALYCLGDSAWAGHGEIQHNWFLKSANFLTQNSQVGDVFKITKNNNTLTAQVNNNPTTNTQTLSIPSEYWVGFYTNNGRIQKVKNIKLKAL